MKTVVIQVVCDDEFTNGVLWFGVVELSCESETDLLVDPLEEIFFWWFWDQLENVAQRVLFRTNTVVWWDDDVCDKIKLYLIVTDRQFVNC